MMYNLRNNNSTKGFSMKKALALAVFALSTAIGLSAFAENNDSPIHFHGYGELHYGNSDKEGAVSKMDNHRLVLGWTYDFSDRIKFNAEVDFEHAAQEMELEFAFIDFLINKNINFRAGTMLMPVGYLNEFHEPPLFYSVERPYVQKNIIPTTWQEGGAGIFGTITDGIRYRAYVVSALNAAGFKASSGIRSGRGKVASAASSDLAFVGRLEVERFSGLKLGASVYSGGAAQDDDALGDAGINLIELDARYRWNAIELTGLFTSIAVDDTESIHAVTGQVVGETISGGYIEVAYHLRGLVVPNDMDLVVFARGENYNTQSDVASGFSADSKYDMTVTTVGVSFMPERRIAVKADVESWEDGSGKSWRQINLGLGYMY